MTRPQIKYYLMKNPKYGIKPPPFVTPTKEDYEDYLQTDSGGVHWAANHIRPYEEYVRRLEEWHNREESEFLINSIEMFGENQETIIKIEQSENFIKWLSKGT
jgi:hypothetical protein